MLPPKVSVIIGAYNCGDFIEETVNSVVNQTFTDWELIIVDDCSSDDTCDKILKVNDKRIKLIRLKENSGRPAVPRNIGIKSARGELIAFLDGDDIWLPEKLEKAVNIMAGSEDIGLTYARFKIIRGKTVSPVILPKPGRYESGRVFRSLYTRSFIACSGVVVRKSILLQIGFFNTDPEFLALEDTDLWLRIAQKHRIVCVDAAPLFLYRINPQGASRGFLKRIKRTWTVKRNYLKSAGKYLFCKAMFLSVLDIAKHK